MRACNSLYFALFFYVLKDTTQPEVRSILRSGDSSGDSASRVVYSNDTPIEVVFTFTEDIWDFTIDNIKASDGCGPRTDAGGNEIPGHEYRVKVNAKQSGTDPNCTLSVLSGKFHDRSGNPNKPSAEFTWIYGRDDIY